MSSELSEGKTNNPFFIGHLSGGNALVLYPAKIEAILPREVLGSELNRLENREKGTRALLPQHMDLKRKKEE